MVISCSAHGCTKRQGHLSSTGRVLNFHRFPLKNPELLNKWIDAVKRKSWLPTSTSYLCGEHFNDDDYRSSERRYLKKGAVPSNFKHEENKNVRRRKQMKNLLVKVTKPLIDDSSSDSSMVSQQDDSSSDMLLQQLLDPAMYPGIKLANATKNGSEFYYDNSCKDGSEVEHKGGCHCGAVRFSVYASPKVKVYVCNCSICEMKQIKGFIVPKNKFKVLKGHDNLCLYTFNTEVARHYFCKTCGVQSFYVPRSNQDGISVMVYCIDSKTIENIEEIPFDGRNWEESILEQVPEFSVGIKDKCAKEKKT